MFKILNTFGMHRSRPVQLWSHYSWVAGRKLVSLPLQLKECHQVTSLRSLHSTKNPIFSERDRFYQSGSTDVWDVNTEGKEIKGRWPEVVGLTVEDAKNTIRKDKPRALFEVVPPNSCVSHDFRPQRVRLYVDHAGIIKRPPCIG